MSATADELRIVSDEVPDETFLPLPARIRRHAASHGDKLALLVGPQRFSWAELGDRVERCAAVLRGEGFGPGQVLAILSETSADYLVAYLACLSAGGCVAPLPATNTDETLARMVADTEASVFIAGASMRGRAEAILANAGLAGKTIQFCLDADSAAWPNLIDRAAAVETLPEPVEIRRDWPFNIIYSSGTTGVPKGIVHEHIMRARHIARFTSQGLAPGKTLIAATTLYSNTSLVGVIGALGNGAGVVLQPKFDAEGFMALVAEHRITHAMTVPVIVQRLLSHPRFSEIDISSLERSFVTSSILPVHVKEDVLRRWPGTLVEMYGLTEGGVGTMLDLREHPDKLASVGRPSQGSIVRLINDAGEDVAPGAVGEIIGRSPAMMRGYFKRPDLTAEALITLKDGTVYFRSGDLGRFDEDGFLFLAGRKKDMIVSGGFNIYAIDLEDALCAHEAVAEAAVVGRPSDEWGETPHAFVVLKPGAEVASEALMAFAHERLGKIQRIKGIDIVSDLPRSSVGKVLKRDLVGLLKAAAES